MDQLIYNFTAWVDEYDPGVLHAMLDKMVTESGYNVLNKMEHHFEPQGYTCLWLLAESHLAVHTFPENGKSYIELSSCNKEKNDNFIKTLNLWQETQKL